jgi:hypothetical protein
MNVYLVLLHVSLVSQMIIVLPVLFIITWMIISAYQSIIVMMALMEIEKPQVVRNALKLVLVVLAQVIRNVLSAIT